MDSDDEDSHSFDDEKHFAEDEGSAMISPRSGRTIKRQKMHDQGHIHMPPSPPTFVSMRQLTEAANAFYNMSLAHEITVDSNFRIEKYEPPEQSLEHSVKETMQRAFWEILRSSLEADPPDYTPALRVLREIKESLNGLVLPNQKTLQRLIDNSLDLGDAEYQIQETGHLNLEAYAIQVINVMRQFCAPVRDQEVEDLRKIDDPVEAFRNAFILLEKMHMDLANFTITQMRPYIRQQAVNYERAKFTDFLEAQKALGIDGLRETRNWIAAAFKRIAPHSVNQVTNVSVLSAPPTTSMCAVERDSMDRSNNDEVIIPTPNNILREAYLALLTWPPDKTWPETMIMDLQRILDLGTQLENIISLTSLVLVACNFVAANGAQLFTVKQRLAMDPNMLRELKRQVCMSGIRTFTSAELASTEDRAKALSEDVVCTVERWLHTATQAATESKTPETPTSSLPTTQLLPDPLSDTLTSQITEVVYGRHPVYTLMSKRALGFLRLALSSHPPDPLPLPPGFSVLLDAVQSSPTPDAPAIATGSQSGSQNPPLMATGLKPGPHIHGEAEPCPKRLQKTEHLSLSNLAGRLMPLLSHNRHVFGPQYAEIIQALLMPTREGPAENDDTAEQEQVVAVSGETTQNLPSAEQDT